MRQSVEAFEADHGIIRIPIRVDLAVKVHGLPHDLTAVEADKLARVIMAYAKDESDAG